MAVTFYLSALVAVIATFAVITNRNAFHALIYLIVSLLAVAVAFFALGAPFAAALELLIYAGAIMVLFVFVVMMLNLGRAGIARERQLLRRGLWFGPALLCAILLAELIVALASGERTAGAVVGPKAVGLLLYGPYLLAVELASLLLLAGLVGAWHIGHREAQE